MADICCAGAAGGPKALNSPRWRRVLWVALIVNAAMFVVEMGAGTAADSRALRADALDFLGDAANYAVSLAVVSAALAWRARSAREIAFHDRLCGLGLWQRGSGLRKRDVARPDLDGRGRCAGACG